MLIFAFSCIYTWHDVQRCTDRQKDINREKATSTYTHTQYLSFPASLDEEEDACLFFDTEFHILRTEDGGDCCLLLSLRKWKNEAFDRPVGYVRVCICSTLLLLLE